MLIYGRNAIREALLAKKTINKLFIQNNLGDIVSNQIIKLAKENKERYTFCDKEYLDKLCGDGKHQGFVCESVEFEYCSVDDILDAKKESSFIVVLDGIEDVHNLGAIIRTCECAGVDGIIIGKHRCANINDTVIKTSAGAALDFKVARVTNISQTIEYLKSKNVWVYGLELGGKDICTENLTGNVAIVVGSEGNGISSLVKKCCDGVVTLKQNGKINSLNASVACGIAVYEVLRQKSL